MRKKTTILGVLAVLVAAQGIARAQDKESVWERDREFQAKIDLEEYRQLAIQYGGRRKPIDTFAREMVFKITDRKRFEGLDPVFMVLSMVHEFRDQWYARRCVAVRNLKLIEEFTKANKELADQKRRSGDRLYISMRDLQSNATVQGIFQTAAENQEKQKPRNEIEKAVLGLWDRVFTMGKLSTLYTIVPASDDLADKWTTVERADRTIFLELQQKEAAFTSALRKRDAEAFNTATAALVEQMKSYDFKVYPYYGLLELEYNMSIYKPFQIVQLVYLLAILALIVGAFGVKPARALGFWVFVAATVLHVGALTGRGFLVSRSPVASLYETLLFMTGFAAVMSLVLEIVFKRVTWFAMAASIVSLGGLFLGDWHPIYADKQSISPLVPVLRSYWLNIHVTCMIASYGACLLAASIGFVHLTRYCWNGGGKFAETKAMVDMENYIYRAIQVGFLLLTVGIILGGVWANQSWGRYWDWDPKETWAFIAWIVYAAYLHMRLMGKAGGIRAAVWSLVGFWFIMFTYLGVSYILPGLHAYAEPGAMNYGNVVRHIAPFVYVPAGMAAFFYGLYFARKDVGAAPQNLEGDAAKAG